MERRIILAIKQTPNPDLIEDHPTQSPNEEHPPQSHPKFQDQSCNGRNSEVRQIGAINASTQFCGEVIYSSRSVSVMYMYSGEYIDATLDWFGPFPIPSEARLHPNLLPSISRYFIRPQKQLCGAISCISGRQYCTGPFSYGKIWMTNGLKIDFDPLGQRNGKGGSLL